MFNIGTTSYAMKFIHILRLDSWFFR